MKTSTAVIKLFLRTSKVLSDGSSPIMLKCSFKGTREVSTGCSCTIKYWDSKKEIVKKGFPNAPFINTSICKMKQDAIDRRNQFELDGVPYTPEMVLKKKVVLVASSKSIKDLMSSYTASLSPTTCKVWKSFWNSFHAYAGDVSIENVDLEMINGYEKHLKDNGLKDSSIKMTLSKLSALCRYAVEKGLIKENPFKRINLRKYKTTAKLKYIHKDAIEVLKEMLLERLIISNGDTYTYIDEGVNDFIDKKSDLFVLAFYLFGYTYQGLSPIDLAQLKVSDMFLNEVNGINYYCWNIKRQKTGKDVRIRINKSIFFNDVITKAMLMFHNNPPYLLPILDGVENDRLKIYKKVSNWLSNHSDQLKEWFRMANDRIVKMNVANNGSIPLIDVEATFYSYRDSFAMAYLSSPKSNPVALATLMGRSPNTLASYISHLSSESDLAKAVDIL